MLKNFALTFLFVLSCLAINAEAQTKVYTPAKDSAERKAIFAALRVPIEKELKQKTIFEAQTFNAQGNWAFFIGTPKTASGGEIDYRNTPYQDAMDDGAFDDSVTALLKKTGGKWKVVTYNLGATDVVWLDWSKDYKAPKAIFPGTE